MRGDPRAGFTLVEVLAALVVTAAFVGVVLPFAGLLASRWWVGEKRVENADAWMQAIARMSDDLSQAVPLSAQQGDNNPVIFTAGPEFVQFVRPSLGGLAETGLETVRLEIRSSAAGNALVRQASRFQPRDLSKPGSRTTILDGPYRLRFRIYDQDHVPRAAWADQEDLPAGVELTATGQNRMFVPPGPVTLPIVARSPNR